MTRTSETAAMPVIEVPTEAPAPPPAPPPTTTAPRRPYLDLFLISFLILFFELACIRWFGSTVVFLTFFTNIVLLACFLGMSVGLLAAGRRQNFIRWVLPLTFLSVSLAMISSPSSLKRKARSWCGTMKVVANSRALRGRVRIWRTFAGSVAAPRLTRTVAWTRAQA